MWKKIALSSLILWISSISFISYKFLNGNAVKVDNRVEIKLSAGDRDLVLEEMRILLKGVKGIIKGLSEDNKGFIEESARGNGMIMAQDVNPALMMKLPKAFKMMGVSVHKDFDELANQVHRMETKQVLKNLDTVMNKCISCHQTYRIVEE